MNDLKLLRQYADEGSQDAFRQIVEIHAHWVYGLSLRQLGDAHLAEDTTQAVFIALARKAGSIQSPTSLSGWLFRATRFACTHIRRREHTRRRHEREAAMIQSIQSPSEEGWFQIIPLLDESVARLGRRDRQAILLRFYQQKSLSEVGSALGLSQEAAKKRVYRAIEQLRDLLADRGVTVPGGVLAVSLEAHLGQVAPGHLVELVTQAVLAEASVAADVTVMAGRIAMMTTWVRIKLVAAVGVLSCILAAMAAIAMQRPVDQTRPVAAAAAVTTTLPAATQPEVPAEVKQIEDQILANRRLIKQGHFRILMSRFSITNNTPPGTITPLSANKSRSCSIARYTRFLAASSDTPNTSRGACFLAFSRIWSGMDRALSP